ncbi:MAG TPA: VWA domain-containing protein [Thermoanaerobaculia bacterium]
MAKRIATALLPAFLAVTPLPAQTSLPQLGETIDVSIVNVDVIVTDRRGNHIRGLTAADFEIRDNGAPQPITNFAEYEDKPAATAMATINGKAGVESSMASPREKRTLVVFIERQVMPPAQADAFIASIKQLLHDSIRPGDAAAVVTFRYAMKVEQEFTGDMTKLDASLDRLHKFFDRVSEDPESENIRNEYMQELLDQDAAAAGQAPVNSVILSGYDQRLRAFLDIRRKINTVNILVNTMAATEGRKVILLATRRFSQYAGFEYSRQGLGQMSSDDDEFNTVNLRDQLVRNANAAGVTLYAVYPAGLVDTPIQNVERRTSSNPSTDMARFSRGNAILLNETAALNDVATRTGGVAGWGFTDVAKIANAMRDDLASYYSLAFKAPKKAATHKISVTTKNRSYTVRARREFIEKTDAMQMTDRVVSSLYQPQHVSTLPIDVQVLRITKVKNRWHIPVVIRIPAASLTALPDDKGMSGSFRVYAAAGGALGIMSDVYEKSQPFTIPKDATDVATKQFTYEFEMVTDARADRIVIGAYDELSKQYGVLRIKLDSVTAPSRSSP